MTTTDFFSAPNVCIYVLRTFEDNDQVILNITFRKVQNAHAYMLYQKKG